MFQFLTHLAAFVFGALSALWWTGALIPAKDAATAQQTAGESFVLADRNITGAAETLDQSRERVRTIIKEVPTYVAADCPPGAGAVSPAVADSLRMAIEQAVYVTAEPAGGLPASSP